MVQGYQWLKERVNSEEGRRQLAKIKELHLLADRMGCTAAQLAIGRSSVTFHFLLLIELADALFPKYVQIVACVVGGWFKQPHLWCIG